MVIAIIAILAAILFPVFAQAKLAAKKTMALAHLKQIGTAANIYATDYDDRFNSVYDGGAFGGNPQGDLQPYMKNWNMWYVNRENGRDPSDWNHADFGYNWGFEIRSAEGMVDGEKCSDGGAVVGCGGRGGTRYNAGKSVTQMADPAKLFAFGDSYDTWRMTIGGDGWILDDFPGSSRNNALRYSAKLLMAFADSHAKIVPWKGGTVAWGVGGKVSSPKRFQDRVDGYCADPNGRVDPFPRSGYPLGTGWLCKDFVAIPESSGAIWWQD